MSQHHVWPFPRRLPAHKRNGEIWAFICTSIVAWVGGARAPPEGLARATREVTRMAFASFAPHAHIFEHGQEQSDTTTAPGTQERSSPVWTSSSTRRPHTAREARPPPSCSLSWTASPPLPVRATTAGGHEFLSPQARGTSCMCDSLTTGAPGCSILRRSDAALRARCTARPEQVEWLTRCDREHLPRDPCSSSPTDRCGCVRSCLLFPLQRELRRRTPPVCRGTGNVILTPAGR